MRFTPHDYQRRAIDFIIEKTRSLLFLDMGLGKSVITLTGIQRLIDWGEVVKVLVIAPKKVAESTWTAEVEKWDHLTLRAVSVCGSAASRRKALRQEADVYVLGRDSTVWLLEELGGKFDFDMIVIDELTSFKNPGSLRFKALRRILPEVGRIVGLTGTPTPNGLLDLWAQVYCVDQGERLGKFITRYRNEYFTPIMYNNITIKCPPKPGAEQLIMDRISDMTLTMTAEDWLKLPEIIITDRLVCLPEKIRRRYDDFEYERVMELEEDVITAASAAALMNKLAQFANGAVYDDDRNVNEIHDEKLVALQEIYESEDSPLLCFYQYQHDRDRIMRRFAKKRVRVYSGDTDLRDWNEGKVDILLAHPASTAFGLNMQQGGNRIAWFGTGWNLELYQQANARLHRQGQTKPVRVFNLIAAGTVDERMRDALEKKDTVQTTVLRGMASKVISEVKRNKLRDNKL